MLIPAVESPFSISSPTHTLYRSIPTVPSTRPQTLCLRRDHKAKHNSAESWLKSDDRSCYASRSLNHGIAFQGGLSCQDHSEHYGHPAQGEEEKDNAYHVTCLVEGIVCLGLGASLGCGGGYCYVVEDFKVLIFRSWAAMRTLLCRSGLSLFGELCDCYENSLLDDCLVAFVCPQVSLSSTLSVCLLHTLCPSHHQRIRSQRDNMQKSLYLSSRIYNSKKDFPLRLTNSL